MTRPGSRSANNASPSDARLAASLSGAVDLSGLKDRADAQKRGAGQQAGAPAGGAQSSSATSVQVTEQNFEAEVLMRSMKVPVLVELGSSRAPTAMTATLQQMAAADGGSWVHAYADVDQAPGIAQAFRAQGVPMVIAVAGGRPLTEFEGEQPEDQLRLVIDKVLEVTAGKLEGAGEQPAEGEAEEPSDPERDAAENALAEGDLAAAEERFQALVDSRSGDHSLTEALRFVQVSRRVADENDPAAEGQSEQTREVLSKADIQIMAGNYAGAFDGVIAAIRTSAGDEKSLLRTRLLELLDTLPANDPDALAARRNLATALY
ncbi:MAG TPA: tetratricopeptide repeat protein [Dietzia timorensis]|uniref:Tetratricopeptide repeat protein n=1 Tax=Dietzia timorensis TaxID=499555 RepID=A0A921F700_9ACTN|nr:tetratricopeptide repeat protein [Dietzia timorensis]HJE91568.1 tetratricopeptide repeat protein [Dietzia timorensis]